jgi:hypothetical protein
MRAGWCNERDHLKQEQLLGERRKDNEGKF